MVIKAVLFDMDGTIIDSEDMHTKVLQEVVKEKLGIELPKEEIEKYVGLDYESKLKGMLGEKYTNDDYAELTKIIRSKTLQNSHLVKKMEYAEEIIQTIKREFKIALVTATRSDQSELFLEAVGLKKYFDVRITASEIENNKPYPDSYLLATEKLGVNPEECVALEDSFTGLNAAKSAGVFCIAIQHRCNKTQDFSKADIVVNNIGEITLDMIRSLG